MSDRGGGLRDAEIVVVGGGAIGCGVAYSLATAGKSDVLVLEKDEGLGRATTSQGAGLCGQVRTTVERVGLAMESVRTFEALERTAEVKPRWRGVGSLRIALSDSGLAQFDALEAAAREAGLDVARLSPAETGRRWPLLEVGEIRGALWCPTDGYMHPPSVVDAYAHACRQLGVRFATSVTVRGILCEAGRIAGVETNRGTVRCAKVVNAAGSHAYHVARLVGLELPIVPVRHEYFVTVPLEGLTPELPCFRVPELSLYGRVAEHALLLGGWEERSLHSDPRSYPLDSEPPPIHPDAAVLGSFAERFARLFPTVRTAARARVAKGWPTFTPDGRFIVGESCRVPGFVMAGGCNAHGISGSRGIGKLVAESLLEKEPSSYLMSLSPDRFTEASWSWETAERQAAAVYETYYGTQSS